MTLKKRSPLIEGLEVVLFAVIIAGIGYYLDEKDPLLVHHQFSFMILWLAIVTLFYGLMMGLIMWMVFALFASYIYINDPLYTAILLENLFFVFLYGLFFTNVHNEIDQFSIKTNYLQLRLKELTNAFFTLKISHDKLESIYITQPASFRFIISDVLENWEHDTPEGSAHNTLLVLEKFFMVKSASIWRVKNGSLDHLLDAIGDMENKINKNDKLIEEVLLLRKPIYLKDLEEKEQTSYIYAVPFLDKRENIVSMLIVKDIPFMFYHEDTLLKINVVYTYIWTEYKKRASLNKIRLDKNKAISLQNENHERQDIVDFKLEVIRLSNILKDFNIDSRVYVVSTKDSYLNEMIDDYFYQSEHLEILDQYIALKCGERYIHFILFPFLSRSAIYKHTQTFNKDIEMFQDELKIEAFDEALKHHIHTHKINSKHSSVKNFNMLLKEFGCHE